MNNLKCVQFGCGGNRLEGWVNHDSEVDISKPLPYPTESVDMILIEHCLEHVNTREGFEFMQESHRILRANGILRICVPILTRITDRHHAADLIVGHGHQMVYSDISLRDMLFAAGFERDKIIETPRQPVDGHYRVIGKEKDDLETLRLEATK